MKNKYAYINTTEINEKEATNLKEWKNGYMRRFGERKGKGEVM